MLVTIHGSHPESPTCRSRTRSSGVVLLPDTVIPIPRSVCAPARNENVSRIVE